MAPVEVTMIGGGGNYGSQPFRRGGGHDYYYIKMVQGDVFGAGAGVTKVGGCGDGYIVIDDGRGARGRGYNSGEPGKAGGEGGPGGSSYEGYGKGGYGGASINPTDGENGSDGAALISYTASY